MSGTDTVVGIFVSKREKCNVTIALQITSDSMSDIYMEEGYFIIYITVH